MSYPNNPPVPASITVDTTASINSGLVGFWPLTNQSGTTTSDLSTGGNDGTLVGSITWEKGGKGYASEHPSANATYISTGYSAVGESAITVSAWVRNDGSAAGNSFGKIVSQSHSGNFDSYISKSTNTALSFKINSTVVLADNADIPAIGTWFHVCFVWEQSVYQGVYVNGVESNTITADTSVIGAVTHNLFIGGTSAAPRPWDGGIQNVRIYNRALTPTEVAELYSVPWAGTDYVAQNLTPDTPIAMGVDPNHSLSSGLVAYWPLSEGSGSSPGDISGNSETLTNGGSSVWATKEVGAVAVVNGNAGKYYSTDSSFSTMIGGSTPATDPWSISLWASLYLTAPYEYEAGFLSIGSSSADGTPFLIGQRSGAEVRVLWGGIYIATTSVSHQVWTNIVIVFDGTTMNYYTNGSLAGSRTSPGTNGSTAEKLWIGTGYNNVVARTDDHIQNVRVYDRALSATEVEDLYNEPWAGVVTAKSAPPQYLTVDTADSINTGLQGFWPLSDGSGTTAVDLSANGNDGTLSGVAGWTASDKGVALDAPLGTGNVSIGTTSDFVFSDTGTMSVSFWAYFDTNNSRYAVIGTGVTTAGNDWFVLREYLSGNGFNCLLFGLNYDNTPKSTFSRVTPDGTATAGEWNHWTVVASGGSSLEIYKDGVAQTLTILSAEDNGLNGSATANTHELQIGSTASTLYSRCDVQNVRIYDRALSAAEVSRLYQDPWAGTNRAIEPSPTVKDLDTSSSLTTNLVGWWPLTEFGPQDTLAYDISGNDYHCYTNSGIQRQVTGLTRAVEFPVPGAGYDLASDTVALDLSGGYTMSVWIRHEEAGGGSGIYGGGIVIGDDAGSSDVEWYYNVSTTDPQWPQLVHNRSNGGTLYTGTNYNHPSGNSNKSNSNGRWEHHIIRYDPSDGSTYSFIDGVKRVNDPVGGPPLATSGKQIRINNLPLVPSSLKSLQCAMQNVRIYDRVLTDAEVQTLYDDPWVGLATDSLVYAYYSAAFLQRLG